MSIELNPGYNLRFLFLAASLIVIDLPSHLPLPPPNLPLLHFPLPSLPFSLSPSLLPLPFFLQECGEKQTLLERAQREKKTAERELERVTAQHTLKSSQVGESIQQLHSRVQEAERAGEEARRKMEVALLGQRTAEARWVEEEEGERGKLRIGRGGGR